MVEKAKSLGAEVPFPPTPVPGVGSFAVVCDPTGGTIGIFQPADR